MGTVSSKSSAKYAKNTVSILFLRLCSAPISSHPTLISSYPTLISSYPVLIFTLKQPFRMEKILESLKRYMTDSIFSLLRYNISERNLSPESGLI